MSSVLSTVEDQGHFIFQITSRWRSIADSDKSYNKRHQFYISYTKAQPVRNLPVRSLL